MSTVKPVRWIALRDTNLAQIDSAIVRCDGAELGTPSQTNPLYKEVPVGNADSPAAAAKLVAKVRAASPAWDATEQDHWVRWGDRVYDRYGRDGAVPPLPLNDDPQQRIARFVHMRDDRREKALLLIADPAKPHVHLPAGRLLYDHQAKTLSDAMDVADVCEALVRTNRALCPVSLYAQVESLVSQRAETLETGTLVMEDTLRYQGTNARVELGLGFFSERELADSLTQLERHNLDTHDMLKDPTAIDRTRSVLLKAHERTVPEGSVVVWSKALPADPAKQDWGAQGSNLMVEARDLVRLLDVPVVLLYGYTDDDGEFRRMGRLFNPPGAVDPAAPRDLGITKTYTDELADQAIALRTSWFDRGLDIDEHNTHPSLDTLGQSGGRTPEAKTKRFEQALVERDANYFHGLCHEKGVQATLRADPNAQIATLTQQTDKLTNTVVGNIARHRASLRIKSLRAQLERQARRPRQSAAVSR